ncbi:30S ribosomal protein S2 [Alphaproteobacteria bacterium]|nr:30S ribosomal protein S2 [Alphaproteobacteria bacterium]
MSSFNIRQLMEAGVHYGHVTRKWNPKMELFIFGKRNGIHIIDLEQTVPLLEKALQAARDVSAENGRILFVGTKPQATEITKETAIKCGQYFVNHKWPGGMLTNWKTINQSIKRMKDLDEKINKRAGLTKKEVLQLEKAYAKLEKSLGGIRDMGGLPDLVIVLDTIKEAIAVSEAKKLGIPLIAIIDTNSDPDGIDYPVPGNDDATKAIGLYCNLLSAAILDGVQQGLERSGVDMGLTDSIVVGDLLTEKLAEA